MRIRVDRRHLQLVLKHAAALGGPGEPDAALMQRFVQDREEAAFAELVRRHGRLVWALCRNLLPTESDADDAFQATFYTLARSPGSVRDPARLGAWLHGVAYRICQQSKRTVARQKRRDQLAATGEAIRLVADSAWETALAAVHEEVHRLPESQRVAFVLCCLEGRSVTETAAQLGWKLGTLSARLTRAKKTILVRLAARGLAAGVLGAAAVSTEATAAVPNPVLLRTIETLSTDMVPSSVLSLSQGVLGMAISRTKYLAAVLLMGGGLAVMVGSGWLTSAEAQAPTRPTGPIVNKVFDEPATTQERPLGDAQPLKTALDEGVAAELLLDAVIRQAGAPRAESAVGSTPKWDYDFVIVSDMGSTKFLKFLGEREARGWDYVGEATLLHEGKKTLHWVFRRPVVTNELRSGRLRVEGIQGAILDYTPLRNEPGKPAKTPIRENVEYQSTIQGLQTTGDQSTRIAELEVQIQTLTRELQRLRYPPNMISLRIAKNQLVLSITDSKELLDKLAATRFGKDQAARLAVVPDGTGLTLNGDEEAVRWAESLLAKLAAKQP